MDVVGSSSLTSVELVPIILLVPVRVTIDPVVHHCEVGWVTLTESRLKCMSKRRRLLLLREV